MNNLGASYEELGKAVVAAIASVAAYLGWRAIKTDRRKDATLAVVDNQAASIAAASQQVIDSMREEIQRLVHRLEEYEVRLATYEQRLALATRNYNECIEERAVLARRVDRLTEVVVRDHPDSGPGLL